MFKRNISDNLMSALADTPAVLLNGARQTGKSTLVRSLDALGHSARYFTLDDRSVLSAVQHDPTGFLQANTGSLVIDEVQRAPDLFISLKAEIDRDRRPGRFLLTGSANVLMLPRLSESLAGRMEILPLWPLSQTEICGTGGSVIDNLFDRSLVMESTAIDRSAIMQAVVTGGYPEAIARTQPTRRRAWFASYISTILQRDIQDLSSIEGIVQLPRLLSLLAARSPALVNYAELSRSLAIPQTTLKRYMTLLRAIFLVHELPPWFTNSGKRLVKTAKLHFCDSGLMAHLRGINSLSDMAGESFGALLETFVAGELARQAAWSDILPGLFHYRTQTGQEVDIVLESPDRRIVGIEVKASSSVSSNDFKGLASLAEVAGDRFVRGVVLHCGQDAVHFSPQFAALPVGMLWG